MKKKFSEMPEWDESNRERKLRTNKTKFWCQCDRVRVGKWVKCNVCGQRKLKKI
jgi:hypothetical protein